MGLVSDGLIHAGGRLAMRRACSCTPTCGAGTCLLRPAWWSGICLGIGGFQLYEGTIQHKLLRFHQFRYRSCRFARSPSHGRHGCRRSPDTWPRIRRPVWWRPCSSCSPPVAAALDIGDLWALYRAPLPAEALQR
ncbi:DUF2243 domain-containing protein [Streptomyces sp. V4I2]|uniref:DUF2243 domain-containing protein n=1 Tax=Streptomyces sp. V4I2 TaxID=3042280 RepID=UPI0035935E1C